MPAIERVKKILGSLKDQRKRFSERELNCLEIFTTTQRLPDDFQHWETTRINYILKFLENGEPEDNELEDKYQEFISKYNDAEYCYYQAEKEMQKYEEEMRSSMTIRDILSLLLQS